MSYKLLIKSTSYDVNHNIWSIWKLDKRYKTVYIYVFNEGNNYNPMKLQIGM